MHRRMVRQAIASAIPPERKKDDTGAAEAGAAERIIDGFWKTTGRRRGNRGTRRTGSVRGCAQEHPEQPIGEPTVRRYVAERKRELGLRGREVFVPQSYSWGQEAQVDWFEATGEAGRRALHAAVLRDAEHGVGRRFHRAYTNATQQAFLEGHELGFALLSRASSAPCAMTT